MSFVSTIAVYFVAWWICLFVVLPWGVRTQDEAGEVIEGTTSSAPVRPRILKKSIITSILAAIVTLGIESMTRSGLTFDDIPFMP